MVWQGSVGDRRPYANLVAKGLPDEEIACSQAEGCGSINKVGWRFQSFGINGLEMVDQTGIEPLPTEIRNRVHTRDRSRSTIGVRSLRGGIVRGST